MAVDARRRYQSVDGFGFSEAFQRSNILHGSRGLSPAKQQQVLDLLFTRAGADFSILRNGIGSSPTSESDWMRSIAPADPGGPDEPLDYQWDGDDNSQVWLTKEAMRRGVRQVSADAWSAPGYMKTNGSDANGGTLCGMPGTSCPSGDWRQTYADYLVQYVRFYRQEGIPIDYVGFVNEPDIDTEYASMEVTPAQAADFVKVLGPTLARSGLGAKVACCEGTGWDVGRPYIDAILADPAAARWLSLATAHGYSSPPDSPLTDRRPVWQTEWAQLKVPWNPNWDDGTDAAGILWAQRVQDAFTQGPGQRVPVLVGRARERLQLGADPARRRHLHAVEALLGAGRVQPLRPPRRGADRGRARTVTSSACRPSATATGRSPCRCSTAGAGRRGSGSSSGAVVGSAVPYTVDATHDLEAGAPVRLRGGALAASVPARALVTYEVRR